VGLDVQRKLLYLCCSQCFPFYTYAPDGSARRENITDWALARFREHYQAAASRERKRPEEAGRQENAARSSGRSRSRLAGALAEESSARDITKWDIFYYVYGLLHHPEYRTKFADNLKRELPRIPLAPNPPGPPSRSGKGGEERSSPPGSREGSGDSSSSPPRSGEGSGEGFWLFADAGRELARLHLDYEKLDPWPLEFIENPDEPLSYRVEKMKLAKDKQSLVVNSSPTLRALPPECFEYRLGNRSALEWVIDQYQVKEDQRSGIRSDPNRADDPEYIVRLVGQVVRVSVETVGIVKGLPVAFADTA